AGRAITVFLAGRDLAGSRLCPLDQTRFQSQLPPQPALFAGHFAMVALVIEARQVQDAMQRQNLHLIRHRVAQARRIFPGDVRGNCHISGNGPCLAAFSLRRRKRQNVGGFVGSAESPVQSTQLGTVRHQHIHRFTQTDQPPRPQHKTFERGPAQPSDSLSKDNQLALSGDGSNTFAKQTGGPDFSPPARPKIYSPEAVERSSPSTVGLFTWALFTPAPPDSVLLPPASSSICCSATSVLCSS